MDLRGYRFDRLLRSMLCFEQCMAMCIVSCPITHQAGNMPHSYPRGQTSHSFLAATVCREKRQRRILHLRTLSIRPVSRHQEIPTGDMLSI